ncbi:MAG: protein translocase subunit SecD, partial [Brooklawnia sp.]
MAKTSSTSTYRPERTLIGFGLAVIMLVGLMALSGSWTPRLGLDLRGGTTITLTARSEDGSAVPRENLETARTIIQNRVDSLGVGEASVTVQGNDKIEVAVPNVSSEELVALVGTTAKLSFRPVIAVQEATPAPETEPTPEPGEASPTPEATQTPAAEGEAVEDGEAEPAPASTAQGRPVPGLPTEPPAPRTPRPTAPGDEELSMDERLNYQLTEQDVEEFLEFQC